MPPAPVPPSLGTIGGKKRLAQARQRPGQGSGVGGGDAQGPHSGNRLAQRRLDPPTPIFGVVKFGAGKKRAQHFADLPAGFAKRLGHAGDQPGRRLVGQEKHGQLAAHIAGRGRMLGQDAQGRRPFAQARALDRLAQQNLVRRVVQLHVEIKPARVGIGPGRAYPPAGEDAGQGLDVGRFLRAALAQRLVIEKQGGIAQVKGFLGCRAALAVDHVFPVVPGNKHGRMHGCGRQQIQKPTQGIGPHGLALKRADPEMGQPFFGTKAEVLAPEFGHAFGQLARRQNGPQKPGLGRFQGHHIGPIEGAAHGIRGVFAVIGRGAVFPKKPHGVHLLRGQTGQGAFQFRRFRQTLGRKLGSDKGVKAHGSGLLQCSRGRSVGQAVDGLDDFGINGRLASKNRRGPKQKERGGNPKDTAGQGRKDSLKLHDAGHLG